MKLVSYIILTVFACLLLVPLLWMVLTAFQPSLGLIKMPPNMANSTIQNFIDLFQFPILRWTFNSIIVVSLQMFLGLLVSLLAAYGFTFRPFPGSEIIFWCMLAAIMIPGEITLIPKFLIIKALGLFNTLIALIIPSLGGGIVSVFFFRQFLKDFPRELIGMAEIDGCGDLGKFYHLVIPLLAPAISAMLIIRFPGAWKAFLWPLIVTSKNLVKTLPIGLYLDIAEKAEEHYPEAYGLTMAGAVYSFLPIFLVFISCQRYFTKGLFSGAMKE